MKWKTSWFVIGAILFSLTDLITAYFILPGESNPLFLAFGGFWILIVGKLFFIGMLLWWAKKRRTEHNHYFFCMSLVWSSFLFCFGTLSNITGILNPAIVEAAALVAPAVKTQAYFNIVSVLGIIPMVLGIITFEVFYRTRDVRHPVEVRIHG